MERLRDILDHLRGAVRTIIRMAQRVVMAISLFLVYFVAMGATWVLAWAFARRLVRRSRTGLDSYWEPAEGYDPDPDQAIHQS